VTKLFVSFGILSSLFLTSCASSTYKARQEQREKLASSSGMYCDWVNGDKHSDVEVELSLQMAKRCDSNKAFSLTTYKNNSDQNGVMYCCVNAAGGNMSVSPSRKSSGPAAQKSTPAAGSADDIVEDK
jgi:hypothetical protein